MIDIHIHILPGIDDGAFDIEESLQMAELAVRGGVHTIVATPHCNLTGMYENYYDQKLKEHLYAFRNILEEEKIPLTVLSGMEIYTTEDVVEKIEQNRLIPIHHSRYYLMEFHFGIEAKKMEKRLQAVLKTGRIPIIAHPERYDCLQDYPELLYYFMKAGCLSQVNKGSLLGNFGYTVKETVDFFMKQGLVTCIASDAHSSYQRTPFMGELQEYMERKYSYQTAKRLLYDNPKKILENKEITFHGNVHRI
jgi:protein-tyrosine phosphatase